MKCARCGAVIYDGDVFCAACGFRADEAAPSDKLPANTGTCTLCGKPVPQDAAYCLHCGTPRRFSANFYPAFFAPKRSFVYGTASRRPRRLYIVVMIIAFIFLIAAVLLSAVPQAPGAPIVHFNSYPS